MTAPGDELEQPVICDADGLHSSMPYHTHRCQSLERSAGSRAVSEDEIDRYNMRQCDDCRRLELAGLDLSV